MSTSDPRSRINRLYHLMGDLLLQTSESAVQAEYGILAKEAESVAKEAIEGPPKVQIAKKSMRELKKIFNLRLREKEGFLLHPVLRLKPGEGHEVPELVEHVLKAYEIATAGSPENEPYLRTRVDVIILLTLAEKKEKWMKQEQPERFSIDTQLSQESYQSLHCQLEMHMQMPGREGGRPVIWTGRTDYSLWYGDPDNAQTNLVVLEAKRCYSESSSYTQSVGYLALINQARRQVQEPDSTVFGISTDGDVWRFICIDNESKVSSVVLSWYDQKEQIILLLHRIIDMTPRLRKASSSISRTNTVTEETGLEFRCGTSEEMDVSADSGVF